MNDNLKPEREFIDTAVHSPTEEEAFSDCQSNCSSQCYQSRKRLLVARLTGTVRSASADARKCLNPVLVRRTVSVDARQIVSADDRGRSITVVESATLPKRSMSRKSQLLLSPKSLAITTSPLNLVENDYEMDINEV